MATDTTVATPNDLTYGGANTTTIKPSLVSPVENGDIFFFKGCVACDPLDLESTWSLEKRTIEYNAEIGKWISIDWNYELSLTGGTPTSGTLLNKNHWHVSDSHLTFWKQESYNIPDPTIWNAEVPDILIPGEDFSYSIEYSGRIRTMTYTALRTFSDKVFPDIDNTPRDGFVLKIIIDVDGTQTGERYCWNVISIGQTNCNTNDSITDDGTNVQKKVIYKKAGESGTEYGTRPDWLTDEFIEELPTTF